MVTSPETGGTTGGSSDTSTRMALGSGGTAGSNGTLGASGTPSSSTGEPDVDAGCVTAEFTSQWPQRNLLFLLDQTGSNGYDNYGTGCTDHWDPAVDMLNAFFGQMFSSRLFASLAFLPAHGTSTSACDAGSYSGPPGLRVPLTSLDDAGRKQFQDELCSCGSEAALSNSTCMIPNGGTPTRPAIQGTIDYASSIAQKYPDSGTYIVFITDGEPGFACQNSAGTTQICNSCEDLENGCLDDTSQCVDRDTEVQKISSVIQSAPWRIHVVAIGSGPSEPTLNEWAAASGNDLVDLRGLDAPTSAAALAARFLTFRGYSIRCDFDIPLDSSGELIDPKEVYVYYAPSSGSSYYLRQTPDGTSATCATAAGYWYFDDPRLPKKVNLCAATCDALLQETSASLRIEYGCRRGTTVP